MADMGSPPSMEIDLPGADQETAAALMRDALERIGFRVCSGAVAGVDQPMQAISDNRAAALMHFWRPWIGHDYPADAKRIGIRVEFVVSAEGCAMTITAEPYHILIDAPWSWPLQRDFDDCVRELHRLTNALGVATEARI